MTFYLRLIDKDRDGHITPRELKSVLRGLGKRPSEKKIKDIMKAADKVILTNSIYKNFVVTGILNFNLQKQFYFKLIKISTYFHHIGILVHHKSHKLPLC